MRQRRHEIDAIRTVCWFHALRIAAGATSTYQMDELIEVPLAFGPDAGIDRKNKWRSYRKGIHTPSVKLVDAIEQRFAGSRVLLNHPVWQMLRLDRPVPELIPSLLVSLPPAVYVLVRNKGPDALDRLVVPNRWNVVRLRQLERQVGLDSLACLVALLRLSAESGNSVQAFKFGRSVCRSLLLIGPWLLNQGIADSIVDYLERWVLPLTTHDGLRPGFGDQGFLWSSRWLFQVARNVEADENKALTTIQRAELMLDLLDDKFTVELSGLVGSVSARATPPTSQTGR